MYSGSSRFLLVLLLLLPAYAGDQEEPCVIRRGPPCITLDDPRLKDKSCRFEEEACITLQWDEYGGDTIIEAAVVKVTPTCWDTESAAVYEKRGRAYLDTMQTLPITVTVETLPCAKKGFVDVQITKSRKGIAP